MFFTDVNVSQSYSKQCSRFALKWTPRVVVAGVSGYYCLGIAYERGLMAAIDRIAIRLLLPSVGYTGLGVFMPTFQWYSAWGVRISAAISTSLLYDGVERILIASYRMFFPIKNQTGRKLHLSDNRARN